jgi:dethiobiotin synthetase
MARILVAGIGTEVGKTVVAGILTMLLDGDYWKPIQTGDEKESDPNTIKKWVGQDRVHPSSYSLKARQSPHHAARLENIAISCDAINIPNTARPLIIESVGGVFVPLTSSVLSIDLFKSWNCKWVIVSKHYLGSINHTLLTIDALKQHGVPILGIIFNGIPNHDTEDVILKLTNLAPLGRLLPEPNLNKQSIHRYVKKWQPQLSKLAL